jgi:hypothetical protein
MVAECAHMGGDEDIVVRSKAMHPVLHPDGPVPRPG